MANVSDAMKKHNQEEGGQVEKDAPKSSAPAPAPDRIPADRKDKQAVAVAAVGADGEYSESLVVHHDRGGAITEEYRSLRTNLLAQCPDDRFCFLVTSADESEGKTVTCLNLGLVMSERVEFRTVVVDFDLRKCDMADLLDTDNSPGMADLLCGSVGLDECIQATLCSNLFFIPAGRAANTETGELVGRPELDEVVSELRRKFDYVIFDTPPIHRAPDAGILGRVVSEALLVVQMNKTKREDVEKAIRLMHAANVNLSGIILTHRKYDIKKYDKYKYGYGYGYS